MGEVEILHPNSCLKKHLTTMKSRRTIRFAHNSTNPSTQIHSFTLPDTRQKTPTKGILKNPNTNSSVVTQNKSLVMGQVKILKRGEALQETSKVLKDVNYVKKAVGLVSKRPENFEAKGHHKVLTENKKISNSEDYDVVVSSTNRIGPDPKIVSKQIMKKKMTECFSGTVFSDSPHPSSVPLPSFFMKNRSS
uniref:uncharacterized protein LOC122585223 n=1 Tax=Erigeron canadensis TaxID=72917 RepID=UPI001CB8B7BD|nr:uncharacterized protein LOC122585223 [Erigeron canadensis]